MGAPRAVFVSWRAAVAKKCKTGVFCVVVEIKKALNSEDGLYFSRFLDVF